MKRLIRSVGTLFLCVSSVMLLSCGGGDDNTTQGGDGSTKDNVQGSSAEYAIVKYELCMTPDLLGFVTPEVVFLTDGVEKQKLVPSDKDWVDPGDIELKDNHGNIVKMASLHEWKYETIFDRLGVKADMIVRYLPKTSSELTKESYDFDKSMKWLSATVHTANGTNEQDNSKIHIDIDLNIYIGGAEISKDDNGFVKKESVYQYIQYLTDHPDTLKLQIQNDGEIVDVNK